MPRTKTTRVAQTPSAVLKLGSLIVMGQDCTPKETTVEELEAAADVFRIAASMVRANPSLHLFASSTILISRGASSLDSAGADDAGAGLPWPSNQIAAAVEPERVGSIHEDPDGARCDSCGAEVGTPHSLTCEYEQVPL